MNVARIGEVLRKSLDAIIGILTCDRTASGLLNAPFLLEQCGGLDCIEVPHSSRSEFSVSQLTPILFLQALQSHADEGVYSKAVELIEEFFPSEEEALDQVEPSDDISGSSVDWANLGLVDLAPPPYAGLHEEELDPTIFGDGDGCLGGDEDSSWAVEWNGSPWGANTQTP